MATMRLDAKREEPRGPGISPGVVDIAVRMTVAAALMAEAVDLIAVSVPDRRIGTTIYWAHYHLWWLTIPAAIGATVLMLPEAVAGRRSIRPPALFTALVLMIGGLATFAVVAPILARREAVLYDHPSAFDIGVALSVPAAYGVVQMMAAVLIAGRVFAARWGSPAVGALASLGFFACIGPVFAAQFVVSWRDWTSPQTAGSLRAVFEAGVWALAAVVAGLVIAAPAEIVRSGIGRTLTRIAIVVCVGGGVVLGLSGWTAAAACVAGAGAAGEYACAYAAPLIVASTIVAVGGLTLARRIMARAARS